MTATTATTMATTTATTMATTAATAVAARRAMGQTDRVPRSAHALLLCGLALAVPACNPRLNLGSSILWSARHETGDLREWSEGGKGGTEATVTDANVVLGYLPKYLLGGSFALDVEAANDAVQKVADALGVGLYEAAEGILKISNETMYGALRHVTVEQGYDPREFSLVTFGGAGPLHANSLGKLLGTFPVIIPSSPGVLCAFGDATTVLRHEVSRTHTRVLQQTEREDILNLYVTLLTEAKQVMSVDQGVPESKQVRSPISFDTKVEL